MTSPFPQFTGQDGERTLLNAAFNALSHQATYSYASLTSSGLTWGYYGGRWGGFSVAAGTFTLSASGTNYIVVAIATGVTTCSTSSTNWNDSTNYARVYKLTTNASAVTAEEDHRAGPGGVYGGGAATSGSGDALVANPLSQFAATTSAQFAGVISDETGTGLVVLNNAPTLINPIVGTQSPGDSSTKGASTAFVVAEIASRLASGDVMVYKGVTDCSANPNYPAADAGWVYVVSVAGKIGGASGVTVEAGDLFICKTDSTASGNQATVGANWDVIQTNITGIPLVDGDKGDITVSSSGAAWAVDNDVVTYAKMQNVSATSKVLGRKTAGSGDPEECSLSEVLDFIGSAAHGDMLYRGASAWTRLAAGAAKQVLQANGAAAPSWVDNVWVQTVAISDLATALATGTGVGYFDLPFDVTLTEVIATVQTSSSSGLPQFNVKKNGTTVFSTNVTIDASETSSLTAATPAVISVSSGVKGDRYTFDIVAAGTGTKGAQITCAFKRA